MLENKLEDKNINKYFDGDFSPLFIASLLARPLPSGPINLVLKNICQKLITNHPDAFNRLEPIMGKKFIISPTDLQDDICVIFQNETIDAVIESSADADYDVKITGSMNALLSMLDGEQDGDALFFNRQILVEGDTEALLTLRNAMDSEDINLKEELVNTLGIFKKPAEIAVATGSKIYNLLERDMESIRKTLISPLTSRINAIEQENATLKAKISDFDKALRKAQNKIQSLSRKAER